MVDSEDTDREEGHRGGVGNWLGRLVSTRAMEYPAARAFEEFMATRTYCRIAIRGRSCV